MSELDTSGAGDLPATGDEGRVEDRQGAQQPRDDSGRYAGPAPDSERDPSQGREAPEGFVPHAALHAAREEAKELKRWREQAEAREALRDKQFGELFQRLAQPAAPTQPQAQQTPPDPWSDPEGFARWQAGETVKPLQERMDAFGKQQQQQHLQFSQMMAARDHGQETVQAADAALAEYLRANPGAKPWLQARITGSPHPYDEMVRWHREQTAASRSGGDPDAAANAEIERRVAARLAEMGIEAPQPPAATRGAPAPQAMPQSFTGRSPGPRSAGASTGPLSLSQMLPGG